MEKILTPLMYTLFDNPEYINQDIEELLPYMEDYTEEDLIEDSMDYAIQSRK